MTVYLAAKEKKWLFFLFYYVLQCICDFVLLDRRVTMATTERGSECFPNKNAVFLFRNE